MPATSCRPRSATISSWCVLQEAALRVIRDLVREVGERIQPQLHPHPGLAQRNAYAHIWLGVSTVFGEEWRERASEASVVAFLEWIEANPNTDYEEYDGPRELAPPEPGLFG